MSIRFGTSRVLSSRANVRRIRGASTAAKTATPGDRRRAEREAPLLDKQKGATNEDSTGACGPLARGARRSGPPPAPRPVWGGRGDCGGRRLSAEGGPV